MSSIVVDRQSKGVGELSCPESNEACEAKAGVYCPTWNETVGEMPDPGPGSFSSPYQDILDGDRTFITTYPGVADYPTCPFQPPAGPLPENWADACVENMKRVGFLDEIKGRPNEECPAGWFLCKGLCYVSRCFSRQLVVQCGD